MGNRAISSSKITAAHETWLANHRRWVAEHFDDPGDYAKTSNKLSVVRTILVNRWVEPHETGKLQALGVAFGDAIAETTDMHWVTCSDSEESWPALRYNDSTIFVHPLTTISKRVEQGHEFDVFELFRELAGAIERAKDQAD